MPWHRVFPCCLLVASLVVCTQGAVSGLHQSPPSDSPPQTDKTSLHPSTEMVDDRAGDGGSHTDTARRARALAATSRTTGLVIPNFQWLDADQSELARPPVRRPPSLVGGASAYRTLIGRPASRVGVSSARRPITGKIFGGVQTNSERHPYVLQLGLNGTQHCGAVIVGQEWAITVAHCLYDSETKQRLADGELTLRAGSSVLNNGGSLHRVLESTVHGRFDNSGRSFDYDIAVLKVNEPFHYGRRVKRISLRKGPVKDGSKVTVIGWGLVGDGGEDGLPARQVLRSADLSVTNSQVCDMTTELPVTERMMCAGDGAAGFCQSDAGSPLVLRGQLVGLASFGGPADCLMGSSRIPGVYTRLSALTDWVRDTARDH